MKPIRMLAAALALAASGPCLAVGALADVSIHDRTDNRRLEVYWHAGKAWVVGKPGNEYQITVRNRGEDVMAVMSVDGVNIVSGETASPDQTGYVLAARRSFDISGWRKNTSQVAAFYFTQLPDSYAARTGRPDNVGVIGVALFKRRPPEPPAYVPPPAFAPQPFSGAGAAGESALSRRDSASASAPASASSAPAEKRAMAEDRIGTGHGRIEESRITYTGFERASKAPAETIAIYYDSYRNLVARGVIREPAVPAGPRPFPGFVPDPQARLDLPLPLPLPPYH